jgi:uncharacterized protein YecT (DUF1311 family)
MMRHFPRAFPFLLLLISACTAPALAADAAAPGELPRVQVLPGEQASFNCAKAQSIDEQIICSNHGLAQLDRRMGEIYSTARAALPKAEKNALLQAQRAWLSGHDTACGIPSQGTVPKDAVACFIKRYQARTAELQALMTRGNVIRELGGTEPWAEDEDQSQDSQKHMDMLVSCVGKDQADSVVAKGQCCGPGGEWTVEDESTATPYVINGKRYLVFTVNYYDHISVTRGMCETQTNENGEEDTVCPNVPDTPGSCTTVFEEQTPGSGEFAAMPQRWDSALTLAELLTGNGADTKFAVALHAKLAPGGNITLAPKKGAQRHYKWNAGAKRYEEGR